MCDATATISTMWKRVKHGTKHVGTGDRQTKRDGMASGVAQSRGGICRLVGLHSWGFTHEPESQGVERMGWPEANVVVL